MKTPMNCYTYMKINGKIFYHVDVDKEEVKSHRNQPHATIIGKHEGIAIYRLNYKNIKRAWLK